jgi:cytochrome c oxidase subunit II
MQFQRAFSHAFGIETKVAGVVFGLVLLAMLVAFGHSAYRRRKGKPASQRAEHNPLELSYLAVVAAVAGFAVFISFSTNAAYWHDPRPDMTVRVTAFQWCWDFRYAGTAVDVTARCAGGPIPTLVLPAGRAVRLQLTSHDVIHGFWVPGLRLKIDVYPDHVNTLTFTPPAGQWVGHCSQLCGLYHTEMLFRVQALPAAAFDRWLHAHGGPAQLMSTR